MHNFVRLLCTVPLFVSGTAFAGDFDLTLDKYRAMEVDAPEQLNMILPAMYQTAVYAQAAIDHPSICFTPVPLSGDGLRAMISDELAKPDAVLGRDYVGDDPLALILVNALRDERVCR